MSGGMQQQTSPTVDVGQKTSIFVFFTGAECLMCVRVLQVVQDLGVDINRREAYALFGRFDINKDGGIVYYEFIDSLMAKGEAKRSEGYYDK